MKAIFLYLLLSCIVFTSCKSIKNLTAKDNSTQNSERAIQNNDPQFLDIGITPGSDRVDKMETTSSTKSSNIKQHKNSNLEDAGYLRVKYATILDVRVEDISNLLLFENIEYWWGTKYCMGGATTSCIDCSAFTQIIMNNVYNSSVPRTAQLQYDSSAHIASNEMAEGDLVFFHTSGKVISHVGIYITNNKFAHASVSSGVIISDLNETYWKTSFSGAGRVMRYVK